LSGLLLAQNGPYVEFWGYGTTCVLTLSKMDWAFLWAIFHKLNLTVQTHLINLTVHLNRLTYCMKSVGFAVAANLMP
jgi:hypothetical protein